MNYEEAKLIGNKSYDPGKPCKQGHICQRRTSNRKCLECSKIIRKRAYQNLSIEDKETLWIKKKFEIISVLFHNAKFRAKQKGLDFNLEKSDITIPPVCPCCCSKFNITPPRKDQHFTNPYAPSLDRLKSCMGYTKENIRIICWRCNRLKGSLTIKELEKILIYMKSC